MQQNKDVLEIRTPAGILSACPSTDPGQPGICIMWRPEGFDSEIDISFVSVYKDPAYRTRDEEGPKDVVIMTYADVYSEDYTKKDILRREDVEAALEVERHTLPKDWAYELLDKATSCVLRRGDGFKTKEDARTQAVMEADVDNIKNYSVHIYQPPCCY